MTNPQLGESGTVICDLARTIDALDKSEDGRTIPEMQAAELSYEFTVERIESRGETHTFVYVDSDGMVTGFGDPTIAVGDRITVCDGHAEPLLGGTRHGWALNGEVVEWRTPWERALNRVQWLAKYDRDQRERFAKDRVEMDARYLALSPTMKARIDRFRAQDPGFRVASEAYEMVACVDADLIAGALRPEVDAGEEPAAVVRRFYDLPWDDQKTKVPGLDPGHSGNTFGGACRLARALLEGGEA